jgi:hypothetical protein
MYSAQLGEQSLLHTENLGGPSQKDQIRLRDCPAIAGLRLSVLLTEGSAGVCSVLVTSGAGSKTHAGMRAKP